MVVPLLPRYKKVASGPTLHLPTALCEEGNKIGRVRQFLSTPSHLLNHMTVNFD